MKLKIGDTNWKIRLLTPEKFISIHGPDSENTEAVTDTGARIVDFKTNAITADVVRHEMFHAYFTLTLTHNADLSMNDMEEMSATLIGKYGEELVKSSRKVFTWLKKKGK